MIRKLRIKSCKDQGPDDEDARAVFWAVDCILADQRFQQPALQSRHVLLRVCWLYAADCNHHSIASC